MAEKAKKKPKEKKDQKQEEAAPPQTKSKKKLIVGIAGGTVFFPALLIAVLKMTTGANPDEAAAAEALLAQSAQKEAAKEYREILLTHFKAPNEKSREMYIYELKVTARVEEEKVPQVEKLLERRTAALEDAFNRVVRSANPEDLKQADLKWLRDQFRYEFGRVAEDQELIAELYIPMFMKFNAD